MQAAGQVGIVLFMSLARMHAFVTIPLSPIIMLVSGQLLRLKAAGQFRASCGDLS